MFDIHTSTVSSKGPTVRCLLWAVCACFIVVENQEFVVLESDVENWSKTSVHAVESETKPSHICNA